MNNPKEQIILKMSQAIQKAEDRGLSGDRIEMLLAHFKKDYNLTDSEFAEFRSQAYELINESKRLYWTCPNCGANLDHGEKCDCKEEKDISKDKKDVNPQHIETKPKLTNSLKDPDLPEESDDPRTWLQYKESSNTLDESTKAQLKKADEVLKNYNSSYQERMEANAIINKHKRGKTAAQWKADSKKVMTKEPKRSKLDNRNLNVDKSHTFDDFGTAYAHKGMDEKRRLLKIRGKSNEEIAEYEHNKKTEKAMESIHKDDLYKKRQERKNPVDVNEKKRKDEYKVEENDDPRTWGESLFKEFIIGLHNILEDNSNRKYFLQYLKSYQTLSESILDPINKERCSDIFKNDVMIPKVRTFILSVINDFKKQVNFPIEIKNIYMIGSSTGYQYTITSDIDLEIETDLDQSKFNQIFKIIPKGVILPGTERPLNIFILKNQEKYDFDKAENVYDIMENKFIKETNKKIKDIPYQYIKDLSTFFMNGCELALNKFDRDVQEMKEYLRLNPQTMEISEKEKHDAITRKLVDIRNDIDVVRMAHHIIFAFEKEGYEDMPFKINIDVPGKGDPRYSVNNLVYKMIDKFGYLERLDAASKEGKKLIKEVESKYGK